MVVLVCYDIATDDKAGERRLRRIAELCKDYGVRVQRSVFECQLDRSHWVTLRHALLTEFDSAKDSLRFYFLGADELAKAEHHGIRLPVDVTKPLIV